jgi:CHRD domain
MKTSFTHGLVIAGALAALAATALAQVQTNTVVQFNATISAGQETTTSASAATGSAVMLYNVAANSYTLTITLNNFPNTLVSSSISVGAAGSSGAVANSLGSETATYTRSGNTLTASIATPQTYLGTPLTLLQRGAYLNFVTASFPAGEVRGQLIAQPLKLYANVTSAQEIPATRQSGVSLASGAAYILYDPGLNTLNTRVSLYNFTNTLTVSHYHEDPPNISGPVVDSFGGAAVYVINGGNVNQVFNQTYTGGANTGNPITLLTGGSYVNFHSNIYPSGEIRGQVFASVETPSTRFVNLSTRGVVGTGNQSLLTGFVITGDEPVLTLLDVRGPSLAPFGVTGTLPDPVLSIWNSAGLLMATNSGNGSAFDVPTITAKLSMPLLPAEPALLLVLSPGAYTVGAASASGATGVVLIEGMDAR